MKLASVLVAAAFVGLAGYTVARHLGVGGDGGPVAEVVTLPPKRVAVPEPVPAVRTAVATSEVQIASPTQNRAPVQVQGSDQKAVAVPGDRASLARALQRELQRVGCYDGEVNGTWTTSTRMAMKSFTDRVNASLPIDQPDYILLSLVQRHEGRACGTNCPTGQMLSDEGRCVPSAVLTKAPTPARPTASTASIEPRDSDKSSVSSSSSWSPTAGLAVGAAASLAAEAARTQASRSAARPDARGDMAPSEPREDRSRYAAARQDADPEAAARDRDRNANSQRLARAEDATKPEAAGTTGNDEPPRKVRKRYKQPKIVRQFLRSMRGVMAGLPF
jgi:hypothetical protein